MIFSILYFFLALLALSFLIFIHELGHYWMAKRVGMRVETFSIGFGKPIYSWQVNGVKWQIGWLFFGGFVKIAGQETDDETDPYEVPGGFFSKTPWQRIKVAFAGPFMNLVFALLFFSLLWAVGGREKNFSEFTPIIGWVDPQSELYRMGVRPGDEIVSYDSHKYQSFKDHVFSPMTASDEMQVTVNKVDYEDNAKTPQQFTVKVYPRPDVLENGITTSGITQPASYIIYNALPGTSDNALPEGSPMAGSGIQLGDRILWVDGHTIFSLHQLNEVLNDDRVLLTIERKGKKFLRRVPRVETQELRLTPPSKEELTDWQYEAKLNQVKFRDLNTIPYDITNDNIVESRIPFIDHELEKEAFPATPYSELEEPLKVGDRVLAINGIAVPRAYNLLQYLQKRRVNIIVQRNSDLTKPTTWDDATKQFDDQVNWQALHNLAMTIGTGNKVDSIGDLHLLKVVTPKKISEIIVSPEIQALRANEITERKKMIEDIEDPEKRAYALNLFENQQNQLILGLPGIQDRKVKYNPSPFEMFGNIANEIGRTLVALSTGNLNPKWMSGPVGIIQMVHDHSLVSLKEALFWLGLISLNLGILNLLPIPVLDGGTIVFCLYELVTRKRIHPKTMEKMIIPFALLLIAFFIFLTYNDVMKIVGRFWSF